MNSFKHLEILLDDLITERCDILNYMEYDSDNYFILLDDLLKVNKEISILKDKINYLKIQSLKDRIK